MIYMSPITTTSKSWLTLREACHQLGVSPATLRQWADTGKVESFRTPGGHRRFRISKLEPAPPNSEPSQQKRQIEMLIHSALGRARLEIASGRLEHEAWHSAFNGNAKEQHRKLGQQLMTLLLQVLLAKQDPADWESEARQIGEAYAHTSMQLGTPLSDILRAYLFFRDYVFEGLFEMSTDLHTTAGIDTIQAYRRLNQFINTMLIVIVESFAGDKKHT